MEPGIVAILVKTSPGRESIRFDSGCQVNPPEERCCKVWNKWLGIGLSCLRTYGMIEIYQQSAMLIQICTHEQGVPVVENRLTAGNRPAFF